MKQFILITFTVLLFSFPHITSAEENRDLLIGSYPYDTETASKEIEKVMEQGYLPVGLEVTPEKEIAILYNRSDLIEAKRYLLYQFDNVETFEAEFTKHIENGWLPMDISFTGDSIFGLFVPSPFTIEGWRVTAARLDSEDISSTLSNFKEKGFNPWGVSGLNNELWFLLLNFKEDIFDQHFVDFYSTTDENFDVSIKAEMGKGWLPWALMKRGETLSILYTQ